MGTSGVLLVSFGAAGELDAVEPFMTSVMGQRPSDEALAAARRRYLTIGGGSPLPVVMERMACALERELSGLPQLQPPDPDAVGGIGRFIEPGERSLEGVTVPVEIGMLHWLPSIDEGVYRLAQRGVTKVVWVSLSPFEAPATTEAYRAAVGEACAAHGVVSEEADPYRDAVRYVDLLASLCITAVGELVPDFKPVVVFTAHSLPVAEAGNGGYASQLEALATTIADQMDLGTPDPDALESAIGFRAHGGPGTATPWLVAYQSKGQRAGEWLGPELSDVIGAVKDRGWDSVSVCPIGFAMDHMETLYDLDVEAADQALSSGVEFSRAKAPNDDPIMIEVVANAVRGHL